MSYFLHPIRLVVAVVKVFYYIIIRSGGQHLPLINHSFTLSVTVKHVATAVVACSFIYLASPTVENRYVVIRKILDIINDEIIVQTITIGSNPLINNHITWIDIFFFDFSQSKYPKTFHIDWRSYRTCGIIHHTTFVHPKLLLFIPTDNVQRFCSVGNQMCWRGTLVPTQSNHNRIVGWRHLIDDPIFFIINHSNNTGTTGV